MAASNTNNLDTLMPDKAITQVADLTTNVNNNVIAFKGLLQQTDSVIRELQNIDQKYDVLNKTIEKFNSLAGQTSQLEKKHAEDTEKLSKAKEQAAKATADQVKVTEELTKKQNENTAAAKANAQTLSDISKKAYSEASKIIDQQRKELVALNIELKTNQKAQKTLDEQYKKNLIGETEYINKKAVLIEKEQLQKQAVKQLGDTIKYNNTIISTSIGSYDNLSAQYSRLKIQINQMSDAEKINGLTKKELEEQSKALYEQMSNLQKATGKSQLDVGQYDKVLGDLNQTLSIIDPRLGMLMTKVKKITPIKDAWLKVNDKLTSSLKISAKTATVLQLGIIGLVAGGIYLAVEAYKKWADERRRLQDLESKGIENAQQELSSLKTLYGISQDNARSMEERKKAAEEMQKLYPDYLSNLTTEDIVTGKAAGAYEKLSAAILKTAKARAYQDELTKIYTQISELENKKAELQGFFEKAVVGSESYRFYEQKIGDIDTSLKKLGVTIEQISGKIDIDSLLGGDYDKNTKAKEEADKKAAELAEVAKKQREALEKREASSAQELIQFRLTQESDKLKRITELETANYDERIQAAVDYEKKRIEAIAQARDNQLSDPGLTVSERIIIEETAQAAITKVQEEGEQMRDELLKTHLEKKIKYIEQAAKDQERIISESESNDLTALASRYRENLISTEEYEREKTAIVVKYEQMRLQNEIDAAEAALNNPLLSEEQKAVLYEILQNAKLAYHKYTNERIIESDTALAKRQEEIQKEITKKRKELMKELYESSFDLIANLTAAQTEKNLQKLEKEAEDNQAWRDEEIERIEQAEEAGAISKEQADAQKAMIDAQAQQREEQIEKRKKDALIKQAKMEKAMAIAKIAMDTAAAIMKNTATLGFVAALPINILTGVLGAVQAATVLAQPLPTYKDGTDNHPGGPAIVGDGGKPELILTPAGKMFVTPSIDTLVDLPKGSQVLPDYAKAIERIMSQDAIPHGFEIMPVVIQENVQQIRKLEQNNQLLQAVNLGVQKIRVNRDYQNRNSALKNTIKSV